MLISKDTIRNKISYWHLACFLVFLPIDFFYSEIVLISFGVHTIIHAEKFRYKLLFTKEVLLTVCIFFLGLLSMIYSSDKKEGMDILGRQSAIVLLPVLFVLNGLDLAAYRIPLLKIFAFTCVASILYLYTDAVRTLFYFHLPIANLFSSAFINHNFSAPLDMHATYLSMYIALSIATIIYFLTQSPLPQKKAMYYLCLLILAAGLIQLSSRAVVISLLVIINIAFPLLLLKGKRRWLFITMATLFSVVCIFLLTTVNSFKVRYIGDLKNDLTQTAVNNELMEPRIVRWKLAMKIVAEQPLIGHGNGSEKHLLRETYFEHKLYISYLNSFNAHSEYISFLIRFGLIGLLVYLYIIFYGFKLALKRYDFLFTSFLIILTVVSISENILDVNKGIFFFSFFLPFFILGSYSNKYFKRQPMDVLARFDNTGNLLNQ